MTGRSCTVEIVVHPDALGDEAELRRAVARACALPIGDIERIAIERRAIDARRGRVRMQLRVRAVARGEIEVESVATTVDLPTLTGAPAVVIVGAGPAGLFCAWSLAKAGVRALVLERGKPVRARRRDLAALTRRGELDPDSNYCFGEGGAGTFSDGKLYTRSSKRRDLERILRAFVGYGASSDILVDARPHIGTNRLPAVVGQMRAHLESAGVEFAFGRRVTSLWTDAGRVRGVELEGGSRVDARAVVVAPGHSARDVQRFVAAAGAAVTFKPFAIGVRIEHPQALIDRLQFGDLAGHPALGAASYRLVERVGDRGVFSFCMCPGGFIAPASTEPGCQVVNGWSPSSRAGRFANSGFVTEVGGAQLRESGYDLADPFAGVAYQRRMEQLAFSAGQGQFVAPAQTLAAFVHDRAATPLPTCSYPRGVIECRLDDVLGPLAAPLRHALKDVGRRMPGFVSDDAIAVALESRTSSPVRFDRDRTTLEAVGLPGLYPAGEGAGFAGGIMSAALDGVRVAEAIAARVGTGKSP